MDEPGEFGEGGDLENAEAARGVGGPVRGGGPAGGGVAAECSADADCFRERHEENSIIAVVWWGEIGRNGSMRKR